MPTLTPARAWRFGGRARRLRRQLRKADGGDGDDEKMLADIESELKELGQARAAAGRAAVAAPEGAH